MLRKNQFFFCDTLVIKNYFIMIKNDCKQILFHKIHVVRICQKAYKVTKSS